MLLITTLPKPSSSVGLPPNPHSPHKNCSPVAVVYQKEINCMLGSVSLQGASFYIREASYDHGTMEEERPDKVYKTRDGEGREIVPVVAFFLSEITH
nr:hypothetical protein [Tanacetum cinerariifolium]